MAITKATFSSLQEFSDWMQTNLVPEYFAAVSLDGSRLTCWRDTGMTEPLFAYEAPRVYAYKSASVVRDMTGVTAAENYPSSAFKCGCGVLIADTTHSNHVIITKNNNGDTVTVISGRNNNQNPNFLYNLVFCTGWGDDTSITTGLSFTPIAGNQTSLVQFCTDAPVGSVSYAPNAFYMPYGQYYGAGLGKFTSDGKTYLTNGYWAILDA